jgi:HD-like signal output (HDOD) protein
MSRLDALQLITAEAVKEPILFAGHVEIGMRIRDALQDPDCTLDEAAKLVQLEPALAAQVVAIANSAAYATSSSEVTGVRNAVLRIGFATLRSLVAAHIVKHLADAPKDAVVARNVERLWQHTTHVAALSRTIAKRITKLDPETALFVGLVHEVGMFYLLSRAAEYPALLAPDTPSPKTESTAAQSELPGDPIAQAEADLTLAVLRQLGAPGLVVTAMEAYGKGYMELPPVTLGDTVLLAHWLAPVRSPMDSSEEGDASRRASIDAAIGESTLAEILSESASEVASLAKALGAA